jgi:uncharacterized cupredoxin-like copper-binding protein
MNQPGEHGFERRPVVRQPTQQAPEPSSFIASNDRAEGPAEAASSDPHPESNEMKTATVFRIVLVAAATLLGLAGASAQEQHGPPATEVRVELGTKDGQLRFVPNTLKFARNTYYKLTISNPSPTAHYFSSDALSTHVFTRKVEVLDAKGEALVEVHGSVVDLEIQPGQTVAWYFYPMTKGTGLPFTCLKKGHHEGGMAGTIDIE